MHRVEALCEIIQASLAAVPWLPLLIGVLLTACCSRRWFVVVSAVVLATHLAANNHRSVLMAMPAACAALMGVSLFALWAATRFPRWRRFWLVGGIAVVAGLWALLRTARFGMPLGISYLAVKLAHVLFDYLRIPSRRFEQGPVVAMCLFAPTYTCGPMHRYEEFVAALDSRPALRDREWSEVLRRLVIGCFKIAVASPYLVAVYDFGFTDVSAIHAGFLWLGIVAYALHLYLNFSGASDVAVGWGLAFGIRVPENFDRPYLQPDIQAFWRNWHITFTRWLQTYIFLPITRNLMRTRLRRRPASIAWIGYTITFLFCGFWHGGSANYLVWGLWHGLGLCVYTSLPPRYKAPTGDAARELSWRGVLWRAGTFLFVTIGWLFFACPLPKALTALARMFGVSP